MTEPQNPNEPNQSFGPEQPAQPVDPAQAPASGAPVNAEYHPQGPPATAPQGYDANGQPVDPYAANAANGGFAPVAPPAPAKRKFGVRQIISLVAVAVLLGIGAWGFIKKSVDNNTMKVGNCVQVTQNSKDTGDLSNKKVDCGTDKSMKVLAQVSAESACGDTLPYTYYSDQKSKKIDKVYCMFPNLQAGKCYSTDDPTTFPAVIGLPAVDCSASNAAFKIEKVIDGVADTSKCTTPADALKVDLNGTKATYCRVAAS